MSIYFNKIYIHLLLHFNIIHPPTSYSHFRQDTIKTKPEKCAIWDTPEEKKSSEYVTTQLSYMGYLEC